MKHLRTVLMALILTLMTAVAAFGATVKVVNINLKYDGKTVAYREKEVHVIVDGKELTGLDMPAVIIDSRTLVPLRAIFEAMGAEVRWNSSTKMITATFTDGDVVKMYIDNKAGTVNGNAFNMDVAPKIINDRTMVPVRAIAEAVGASVGWEDSSRTVTITSYVIGSEDNSNTNTDNNTGTDTNSGTDTNGGTDTDSNKVTDLSHVDTSEIDTTAVTNSQNEVKVTNVTANGNDTYTIKTSGSIWQYKYATVLDSKVAVDIYGGNIAVNSTNIAVNDEPVERIRIAQNAITPYKIVRVVFDLTGTAGNYTVTKSSDGTSLIVKFGSSGATTTPDTPVIGENDTPTTPTNPSDTTTEDELGNKLNSISKVTLNETGDSDVITIYGATAPDYKVFTLNNPYRIVIDIADSAKNVSSLPGAEGANCINNIRMSQFTVSSTRIVLDVKDGTEYSTSASGNYIKITLKKNSAEVSESLVNDGKTVKFTAADGLKASAITKAYNPYTGKTVIYLNGDYSDSYKSKTLSYSNDNPESSYIASAVFSTLNGKSIITLTPSLIAEYNIYESGGYIYIDLVDPRTVYDAVVLIDAGHGGEMPGAVVSGVYEKDITLDIAKRVYDKFNGSNIKIYVTRLTDVNVDNYKRAYMANVGADMFISIHCNSISGNVEISGTETLYAPHSGEGNGALTSYQLANLLQKKVTQVVGTYNRGVKNRSDLIVLNRTTVPAVLLETGFMTDDGDMSLINSASGRQKFADAIYQAINEAVNNYNFR